MLKKLLNVEWRSSGRLLLIVDLGVLGITILAAIFMAIGAFNPVVASQGWFTLLVGLLMFATFMGIFAMMLFCFFINVRSFYRLLGPEGYLMLTLPVSANLHIAAKLLYSLASTAAACIFLTVEMNILTFASGEGVVSLSPMIDNGEVGMTLYFLLLAALGAAGSYLYCYWCIALAGRWPQQRLLASIVLFFGVQFLLQIVGIIVVFGFTVSAAAFSGLAGLLINSAVAVPMFMILLALLFVGFDALMWFLTRHQMTTKLNLG